VARVSFKVMQPFQVPTPTPFGGSATPSSVFTPCLFFFLFFLFVFFSFFFFFFFLFSFFSFLFFSLLRGGTAGGWTFQVEERVYIRLEA
jgi:hypothetical protein